VSSSTTGFDAKMPEKLGFALKRNRQRTRRRPTFPASILESAASRVPARSPFGSGQTPWTEPFPQALTRVAATTATATETLRAVIEAKVRCYPNERRMKYRSLSLATLLAAALVPAAHGTVRAASSGRPLTTVPDVFLTIHVTITDARISLDRRSARRGDVVRFVIRNAGNKPHTFVLGKKVARGAGAQTGFTSSLKPKQEKLVLLFMDYRGPLPYRSTLAHDLGKPGMKGIFKIL
jgi:hypothetical protein